MHAVDERRVDDREIPSAEGEVQPRELGRLRRAEDRRVPPNARGAVRTHDVTDARREEAPWDDEERSSLLCERTRVRQVVHVEPVRDVHDVDRDARGIPEEEQHADGHVLVRRRDRRDRHVPVADVAADLHARVARGNVSFQEVHPDDRADDGEDGEEDGRDLREPRHVGGPPPDIVATTGGAPEDNPTSPAKWHSAKWPGTISRNSGFVVLQISCAYGQRGWNVHPVGRSIGLGSSSATMNSGWRTIARAIATRCRCPPLSSCGYRYMKSDAGASSACSSAFAIRSSRSSRESVTP